MSNVTMGRNVGPLFMRTYGKSKATRKVDAWFSPDYRKKVFSSTDVSDPSIVDENDSSVPLKKRKMKGSKKTTKTAKKKAILNVKERDSDEENVFRPDPVTLPKTTVARRPPREPTRKGADRRMLNSMSDNEKPVAVVRRGRQKKSTRLLSTSESEEDSMMKHPRITSALQGKNSAAKRSDSLENSAGPAIRGKYVTARRRGQSVKSRGPSSKPPVLRPSLTLNSSDDFARAVPVLPRAVTRRKRLPLQPPITLERTSSDVSVGPLSGVRRARTLLRESLNASSDDASLSCHAPLFSSTPSVALARHLSQRLQDPSLSGIHFSVEDIATDTEPLQQRPQQRTPPAHHHHHHHLRETAAPQPCLATADDDGSHSKIGKRQHLAPTKQTAQEEVPHNSQSVVVVEEEEEKKEEDVEVVAASQAAPVRSLKLSSQSDESPTTSSRDQGTGEAGELRQEQHQTSLELFSLAEDGGKEADNANDSDERATARSISQAASGFVTAETRLCSLVEALKERCRTASPVVRLSRVSLSSPPLRLNTSSQMLSAGETFSSCLDSQPATRTSSRRGTRHVGTMPVLELSSCSEIPTPRLDNTGPPALSVTLSSSSDKAESVMNHSEIEEGGEKGEATGRLVGDGKEDEESGVKRRQASELEATVGRLKARCISCQPVILLDTLRLSPFLLRHHGVAATTTTTTSAHPVPNDPMPPPQAEPESSASDSSSLPASATPSFSMGSAVQRPEADEPCAQSRDDQPECRRPKRRRLSDSFPKLTAAAADGAGSFSPERTVLTSRSKQPAGRMGTGRKACVSGLSANRWTKRDVNPGANRTQQQAHDSLDFGRAAVAKHGKELLSSWQALPVTPARAEQLNISSILAGLSPDASLTTHMWSRLKAALSVHKKKTAFVTPRRLALSGMQSPTAQRMDASQDIFASPSLASLARRSQGPHCLSQVSGQEDISDAEKVYQECHQEGPLKFDECIPPARMKLCRKIGEGTFGEVFSTTNTDGQPVALKIIPVEGKQKVNGEDQKTFGEILHEIIISKELSSLDEKEENRTDGFIGLNDLHCVQGSYPKQLLSAWDKFDKQRGSENDRPDFFGEAQLFLILEFEFGGSDLENMNGKLSSLIQAKSILHQVTAALAVAEQALCFEHRDLHWGNVLVKTTKQKECDYILSGETRSIESRGVQVNIIDYSLSRLEIDGLTVSCDISADEELFMGQGDYQFDIYRKMREENSNSWSEYHPHTNVLWLHYLTDKLLGMKYKSGAQGAQARALKSSLRAFHQDLLAFQSATDVLQHSSLFQ